MRKRDVFEIHRRARTLRRAFGKLEDLYELERRDGITVEDSHYEDAHDEALQALGELLELADNVAERSDELEYDAEDDTTERRALPRGSLDRTRDYLDRERDSR